MQSLHFENVLFKDIAQIYLRRHVKTMMRIFQDLKLVDVRDGISDDELNRAFQLLFFDAAQTESLDQIEWGGHAYLPTLTFARLPAAQTGLTGPSAARDFVATTNRAVLHGAITDELLKDVAQELQADLLSCDAKP